jgi:histidinol dehydrogenase
VQVVLITLPDTDVAAIESQVNEQLSSLPRSDAARTALSHSFVVRAPSKEAACAFSNRYAPEHLIINTADAEDWLQSIEHAGSVFLGRWTPESVGDYASGTNHVLPTYGYARMYSGVNTDAFSKKMTVQTLSEGGLRVLGPCVEKMAEVEGLEAHKRAVSMRLADLKAAAQR